MLELVDLVLVMRELRVSVSHLLLESLGYSLLVSLLLDVLLLLGFILLAFDLSGDSQLSCLVGGLFGFKVCLALSHHVLGLADISASLADKLFLGTCAAHLTLTLSTLDTISFLQDLFLTLLFLLHPSQVLFIFVADALLELLSLALSLSLLLLRGLNVTLEGLNTMLELLHLDIRTKS